MKKGFLSIWFLNWPGSAVSGMSSGESTLEKSENLGYAGTGVKVH